MYIILCIQSLDTYTLYTPDIHLHVTMIIIMKIAMKIIAMTMMAIVIFVVLGIDR